MSQQNLELVSAALEAFNRGDFEALAEFCDDDFEFVSVFTAIDGGATYRGRHAWESYSARMSDVWDGWRIENVRLFDARDDRVAALLSLVGEGKNSRVPVDREVGIVYQLRDAKLSRVCSYLDPGEALEAVGLRE